MTLATKKAKEAKQAVTRFVKLSFMLSKKLKIEKSRAVFKTPIYKNLTISSMFGNLLVIAAEKTETNNTKSETKIHIGVCISHFEAKSRWIK